MNLSKTLLKPAGAIIVFAIAALGALYTWLGGLLRIEIEKGTFGPAEIVFATYRGPYQDIGEAWAAFQADWEAAGLETCDALAVYLDPPDTAPEKLRSVIACRIDALPADQSARLRDRFASFTLPGTTAYLASFPYRNNLSYMLGPMKVYPAMEKRLAEDGVTPPVGVETYGVMGGADAIGFVIPYGVGAEAYQPLFDAFDDAPDGR